MILPGTPDGVRLALAAVSTALQAGALSAPRLPARPGDPGLEDRPEDSQAGGRDGNSQADPQTEFPTGSAVDDGTVELVLAEVLNNIVEHAYSDAAGLITLDLRRARGRLCCLLRDEGRPMPAGCLPPGLAPALGPAPAIADLPEGGFGWFLIRSLTRDLHYDREPGCNRLSFSIPDGAAAAHCGAIEADIDAGIGIAPRTR